MLRFCFGFGCCLLFAFGWCFAAYGLIDGVVVLYFGVGLVGCIWCFAGLVLLGCFL